MKGEGQINRLEQMNVLDSITFYFQLFYRDIVIKIAWSSTKTDRYINTIEQWTQI